VKPLLSGPPIKRTPSVKRTLSLVPKLTSYISVITNLYSVETSIKRKRTQIVFGYELTRWHWITSLKQSIKCTRIIVAALKGNYYKQIKVGNESG